MTTEQNTDQQATEPTTEDTRGTDAERTPVDNSHDTEIQTDPDTAHAEETVDHDSKNPNHEAAKYRRQLRDTQAQLEALQHRIDQNNRQHIERIAAQHLAVPADLFDIGKTELADLLDDDGEPDPAKVEAAAQTLLEQRPALAATPPVHDIVQAWRDHLGDNAHDHERRVATYEQRLKALSSFLNVDAFKDEHGQISPDRMEQFSKVTREAYNWPDMGQGGRGGGKGLSAGNAWQDLIQGNSNQ